MGESRGRHRARRSNAVGGALGAAGVAAAGAAVVGLTPTLSASPDLLADQVYYLPGTKIGEVRTPEQSQDFAEAMVAGAGLPAGTYHEIVYPGGFWPVSTGGLNDPTYNQSVADGLAALESQQPGEGDTIVGFSQGAVVATEYKRENPNRGVTYVLIENPNRPNGGILQRFNGLNIPILGISFNGATPTEGDPTVDIARQYDGWADFPTYPLNLLATANAIAGIVYLHGDTQDLDSTAVSSVDKSNPMYYQKSGNTEYYLIPTDRLPILMPFEGIVPDPVLDALDPPLRVIVELGYDRTDYGTPTTAKLAPVVNPVTVAQDLAAATVEGVQIGLAESGISAPNVSAAKTADPKPAADPKPSTLAAPATPKLKPPTKPDVLQSITTPSIATKSITTSSSTKFAPLSKKSPPSAAKAISSALKAFTPKKRDQDSKPSDSAADD